MNVVSQTNVRHSWLSADAINTCTILGILGTADALHSESGQFHRASLSSSADPSSDTGIMYKFIADILYIIHFQGLPMDSQVVMGQNRATAAMTDHPR